MSTYSSGSRLSHFEILSHIGQGGMGDVYKARDTRLNRIVAIKTAKAAFTERFTREARSIAALNHPNIATLYDVGPDYLVMEFIEGEPIKGPLTHEEAVAVARQIAEAIEAAHERGIIHRDLKPGNILRREDGTVKVLDFGLAKALETDEPSGVPSADSPTLLTEATHIGMILGTAAYMSPEQAKGKRADRRADIFSFGVVLYELLTGKPLFTGDSISEVLAAVIKEQPRLDEVPEAWRPLLERCLEKEPRQRLQAIGEARLLLEKGLHSERPALSIPVQENKSSGWLPWAIVAVTLIMAVGWTYSRSRPTVLAPVAFQFSHPDGKPIGNLSLSPDGRAIAYVADTKLWLRWLGELEPHALEETDGASAPFWSPDSAYIGFIALGGSGAKLKRVAVSGGRPQTLDEGPVLSASWGSKGTIVFQTVGRNGGLVSMPAIGGPRTVLYEDPDPNTRRRYPNFLPDGEHFFFVSSSNKQELNGLHVGSTLKIEPIRLVGETTTGLYHPSGLVLFSRDSSEVLAQPFDPDTLKLSGIATPVISPAANLANLIGGPRVSVAADGSIAYRAETRPTIGLVWRKLTTRESTSVGSPEVLARWGNVSQEGTRLLRITTDPQNSASLNFSVEDLTRGVRTRVLALPLERFGGGGFLSPSAEYIYFALRNGPANRDLYRKAVSSTSKEELLYTAGINAVPLDASRDGKYILYSQGVSNAPELFVLPLTGEPKPTQVRRLSSLDSGSIVEARFSPAADYIAFEDRPGGTETQIFIQAVSGGDPVQVSVSGGRYPRWSSDGNEVLFTSNGRLMSATIRQKPTLGAATPRELFRIASDGAPLPFEVAGDRILAVDGQPPAPPVTVKLHWKP